MGCILDLCWCILIALLIEFLALRSWGRLEEEKIGLLKLKDAMNYPNGSVLSSWGSEELDCCRWEKVTCDHLTKHVVQLSLDGTRQPKLSDFDFDFFLDASLFLPFQELQNLSMADNSLGGFVGALRSVKLQVLDLSWNGMTQIPLLSGVQSLKFLNLETNLLTKSSNFQELEILPDLEMLNLGYNFIMSNIPPPIWQLTSLKFLSLCSCELNGSLLGEELKILHNLEMLDISYNNIMGEIPTSIGGLMSLKFLSFQSNKLNGSFPEEGQNSSITW